jgi:hypothetical protein
MIANLLLRACQDRRDASTRIAVLQLTGTK